MENLYNHLNQLKISKIWKTKKDLIILKYNDTIQDASRIFRENNILSAPVYDPENQNWLGMLDVFDILACVISLYSNSKNFSETEAKWSSWCRDIDQVTHRGVRFSIKPVKHVINFSGNNPFVTVNVNGTVFELIDETFCQGIHRVVVMDDNLAQPLGIITQTDVLQYLSTSCLALMTPIKDKTIQQLNLGTRNVIEMSSSALAIHAFYLMFFHKVSAVAITENEKMIGNLSVSDIRGIECDNFSCLLNPVTEFLPKEKTIIQCDLNSTLEDVLLKMVMFRIHRIWILDKDDKPLGLVSMTDIFNLLSVFMSQPK